MRSMSSAGWTTDAANGGLVRHLRTHIVPSMPYGFEEGVNRHPGAQTHRHSTAQC